jgi:hypothetical protein
MGFNLDDYEPVEVRLKVLEGVCRWAYRNRVTGSIERSLYCYG